MRDMDSKSPKSFDHALFIKLPEASATVKRCEFSSLYVFIFLDTLYRFSNYSINWYDLYGSLNSFLSD